MAGGAHKGAARPGSAGWVYRHGWVPVAGTGAVDKRSKAKQKSRPSAPANPNNEPTVKRTESPDLPDAAPAAEKSAARRTADRMSEVEVTTQHGTVRGTSRAARAQVTKTHRKQADAMLSGLENLPDEATRDRMRDAVARHLALLPDRALGQYQIRVTADGELPDNIGGRTDLLNWVIAINPRSVTDPKQDQALRRVGDDVGHLVRTADQVGFLEYTVAHEIGHALDFGSIDSARADAGKRWGAAHDLTNGSDPSIVPFDAHRLSLYASTNTYEYRAECYASWSLGTDGALGSDVAEAMMDARQQTIEHYDRKQAR